MGLKREGKVPPSGFCFGSSPPPVDPQRVSTHKLLALEQVAVVGVCRRVARHETEDFRSQRQDGRVGDGGEGAGVEQELRDHGAEGRGGLDRAGADVSLRTIRGRRGGGGGQTLVLLSRTSTPLRDRKRWTLLFLGAFSVEYSVGIWAKGESDAKHWRSGRLSAGQMLGLFRLSCGAENKVPARRRRVLALCLKPPVKKVVSLMVLRGQKHLHGRSRRRSGHV